MVVGDCGALFAGAGQASTMLRQLNTNVTVLRLSSVLVGCVSATYEEGEETGYRIALPRDGMISAGLPPGLSGMTVRTVRECRIYRAAIYKGNRLSHARRAKQ